MDYLILLLDKGVHEINQEKKEQFRVLFLSHNIDLQETKQILINLYFFSRRMIVINKIMLKILLNKLQGSLILWLKYSILKNFKHYLQIDLNGLLFVDLTQLPQKMKNIVERVNTDSH